MAQLSVEIGVRRRWWFQLALIAIVILFRLDLISAERATSWMVADAMVITVQ